VSTLPVTLPLSDLVDVIVYVAPQLPATPTFNQGLIVGPSQHIPVNERMRMYTTLAQMAADGYLSTDPEYIAASLYFGQSPAPQVLWVGVQDVGDNEPFLSAVQACRALNFQWWGVYCCGAVKADHQVIAAWAQTASPQSMYFYNTADSDVPLGTAGNIFLVLKAQSYDRAIGMYSTDQSGTYPNNDFAGAALMGVSMGLNNGLANSYFTMKFKQLVGVATEPLDETSLGRIKSANGNVYLNYGNAYNIFGEGVVASGKFFDEILNLDMLSSDLQYTLVGLLVSAPAIPLTDPGETMLIHGVNQACERARTRGFIASGVWSGSQLLNLSPGDSMPNGYLAQAEAYSKQSASDRAQRKAMPIYLSILESEAAHSITIGVYVQR
jgi:hypothetical protein